MTAKALPSDHRDILSRSGRSLARHVAQLAAAMANVAHGAGPSAYILVFDSFLWPLYMHIRPCALRGCVNADF
jgi:hypothetical protein